MKKLVKKITYPLVAKFDCNSDCSRYLNALQQSQFWPAQRLQDYQLEKLKLMLMHAYEKVPFYKKRFDACGFDVESFNNFDELSQIPVLTKNDISGSLNEMLALGCNIDSLFHSVSGGTTGASIQLYNTRRSLLMKSAAATRFDSWGGWCIGEWSSIIWPAAVDINGNRSIKSRLKNYLSYRKIMLQMTVISEADIENHIQEINRRSAVFVRGFPSQITEAANYIIDHDRPVSSVRGVVTTGEPLYADQRQLISRAFNCNVYDSYRTRELGPIAQECEEHNGLHISAETVYVETLSGDSGAFTQTDSESGDTKIIVTDLTNYAMPFIRYEIGDLGSLSSATCRCGRSLPLLKKVGGRLTDVIFTPAGEKIAPVTLIPKLFHLIGIMNQFRIIQEAFDQLTIQMVGPPPPLKLLEKQRQAINSIFGPTMRVTYQYVDRILPLKSGKYSFIVNRIPVPAQKMN